MANYYSITQAGKPLSRDKYSIDLETKVFSSKEDCLILDFSDLQDWTFNTFMVFLILVISRNKYPHTIHSYYYSFVAGSFNIT